MFNPSEDRIRANIEARMRVVFGYRHLSLQRRSYTFDEIDYLKAKFHYYRRFEGATYIVFRILRCLNELGISYDSATREFTVLDDIVIDRFENDCFV